MKKSLIMIFAIFSIAFGNFASDISLFNEINLAFKNEFYPGTIEKALQFEKEYPESVFLQKAMILKAEAQIETAFYDDAQIALSKVVNHARFGSEEYSNCNYLLGKIFYLKNDEKNALKYFHKACESSLTSKDLKYYDLSVFYSGKIFFSLKDYDNAIPLFEYVLQTPESCPSENDYYEILQKTAISYNKTNNPEKTIKIFNSIAKDELPQDVYLALCVYCADALNLEGKALEAYDLYCDVVNNSDGSLAVIALKKAYVLAGEKNIGVNTGEVFSKTVDKFKDDEELVNEFWLRLAIDEFENKNYKKANEYFANVPSDNVIAKFFNAKFQIDENRNPKEAEKILLNILQKIENPEKNENSEDSAQLPQNFEDSVNSLLLLAQFQQKKWDEMPLTFEKIKNPSQNDVYALSASYYAKGEYEKVDENAGVLYASALSRSGEFSKAAEIFSSLNLDSKGRLEYAKTLFLQKKYAEAYNQANLSSENEKDYVCGLCQINLKNWESAKNHFSSYIKQNSSKPDFNVLVFFYKGYAEYCLEEYKNAFASFARFNSEAKNMNSYLKQSYEFAAKSALQNSDFKNAAIQAENLIKYSQNNLEKQNSILFCAEIFTDYEDFESALNLLLPYSTVSQNKGDLNYDKEFVSKTLFNIAKIYEIQKNTIEADRFYAKIYADFPQTKIAQEALYRSAGAFYSSEDYVAAFNKFNDYISRYPTGEFVEAALYFGGNCAIKLGETERAVVFNQTLLKKYPESVYAYGANINLLNAFYQKEDYAQALQIAKNIVKKFPNQAADDEIGLKLLELERITQGTDRRIAEKQSEYEKNGKTSTLKGRISGSELVKLLAENPSSQKEAFSLATEILELQTHASEKKYAAENAEFIADYYRKNQNAKEAAQAYLKSAEFYKTFDDSKSATALYSAAEAFLAGNFAADANEVAKLLKELYPQSRQAQRVDRLFEN